MLTKQSISDSLKNSIILVMENKHHSLYKWPSEIVSDLSNDFGPIRMRINNFVSELNKPENPVALMLKAHELLAATENMAEQRVLSAFILAFNAYQNKHQLEILRLDALSHTDDFETIKQAIKNIGAGSGPHAASWEVIEMAVHIFRDLLIADEREKIARDIEKAQQERQNQVVAAVPAPPSRVVADVRVEELAITPQVLVPPEEVVQQQAAEQPPAPLIIARPKPAVKPMYEQVAADAPAAAEVVRVAAQNARMKGRR